MKLGTSFLTASRRLFVAVAILLNLHMILSASDSEPACSADPFLWLEEVDSEKALDWVRARNAESTAPVEADPAFEPLRGRLLEAYNSQAKIPYVREIGGKLYNFWRDQEHVRGIMRRTTLESYRTDSPDWETVIDLDAIADAEGESWVWKGWVILRPDEDLALLRLSRGGGDAVVLREFDLKTMSFVEGGFEVPEAKTRASWHDRDTLLVGSDLGEGTLTESGYPRTTRKWKRGTALADAPIVFEGEVADVSAGASAYWSKGERIVVASRALTFYTSEDYLWREGAWIRLEIPDDAEVEVHGEHILIELRSDWEIGGRVWPAGALLVAETEAFLRGDNTFQMLFEPGPRKSLKDYGATATAFYVNELVNVRDAFFVCRVEDGQWSRTRLETPGFGSVDLSPVDGDRSDEIWLTVTDFLTPTSLYRGSIDGGEKAELLKQLPHFFAVDGLKISQYEATSADGTKIPYFIVHRAELELDGTHPTLVHGYGGFEVSMESSYSATTGLAWLEKGGVFVRANIRGGGEFGPRWHQAALKAKRQRAFDDFIAVGEDLVARGITSPGHLGCIGGSNGGLLTGNMLVQRPDLWGAVVSAVPLLDMKRFHKLLAGASWMGEYGDPDDPEQWAWLEKYSPYHQLCSERDYPPVLFTTSTRDDRVHPAHARKMVARMLEQGHEGVAYYENIEGGHGGAANLIQAAYVNALEYTWLWRQLAGEAE